MISHAILTVIKYLHKFDIEKSQNPFSYITQICWNSFVLFIKKEKKHSFIKDKCWSVNVDNYDGDVIDYTNFAYIAGSREECIHEEIIINE